MQPNPPVGNDEVPCLSNEIPYPEYCLICLNQQQQFSVFLHIFHLFQLLEKLKIVPVDLRKLSNVVNNEVVKKTVYDKLVSNVNDNDTSGFVLKTKYDTDKSDFKKKTTNADKKRFLVPVETDYNAKITEIESKIPSVSGLATNSALNAVENKIPDISLVKKQIMIEK